MLNVSSSDGIAQEQRPDLFGIYEMVKGISAEGRPVWKNSGNWEVWYFFYIRDQWWIGANYTKNAGGIKSVEKDLTEIPSTGWKVKHMIADEKVWVSDPNITITDAGTSATTKSSSADATTTTTTKITSTGNSVVSGAAPVTMSPIKMEQLNEYLTSQLDCPPENPQDPTTNRSVKDPSSQPPAIDLFLNPNR